MTIFGTRALCESSTSLSDVIGFRQFKFRSSLGAVGKRSELNSFFETILEVTHCDITRQGLQVVSESLGSSGIKRLPALHASAPLLLSSARGPSIVGEAPRKPEPDHLVVTTTVKIMNDRRASIIPTLRA